MQEVTTKIDIYTHVLPPKYKSKLDKYSDKFITEKSFLDKQVTLTDLKERFRILEKYEDMIQVLSVTLPPLEEIVGPEQAAELARIANDEMAEWVTKYPQKCITAMRRFKSVPPTVPLGFASALEVKRFGAGSGF